MFKCYRKASQSPIPSWATNQQVLIIFFCAFRNKGEGAPAISDLVQRENNGTGYWIVNMSDSYFGRQQYVIYCSQLRATPSADCNISHIAVFLSSYLIHNTRWREDMNFMFEWQEQYLTSERSAGVLCILSSSTPLLSRCIPRFIAVHLPLN